MSLELKCLIAWPDPDKLRQNLPKCLQKHFADLKCIIDCFEIFIEMPVALEARAATHSKFLWLLPYWIYFIYIPSLGRKSIRQGNHSEVWIPKKKFIMVTL